MKTEYGISPLPAGQTGGSKGFWIVQTHVVAFIAAAVFVLISGFTTLMGYRHFEATRHSALEADQTTADLIAGLLKEHNKATLSILLSYAQRPLFIDAVRHKDQAGAYRHLSDLKKNTEIDLIFVTDRNGRLWASLPVYPQFLGRDMLDRDWYRGVRYYGQPHISNVFKLIVGGGPLAVAMSVPVFDEREDIVGVLSTAQRLSFLVHAIRQVPLDPYMTVSVLDREGEILYNNKMSHLETETVHRFFLHAGTMLRQNNRQTAIETPGGQLTYLTVFPVGECGWSVIVERPLKDIFRSAFGYFVDIGVVAFLLFVLIVLLLIYLRRFFLQKEAEKLLAAEKKLREAETAERETRDYLVKLIDSANAPIIVWDARFRITRFNRAAEELTGLNTEEVLEKEIDLIFPADIRGENPPEDGRGWEGVDIPVRHRDGSVRTVLWNSATLFGPDGRTPIATIAQGQDITERKQAEEALKLERRQLQQALDEVRTLRGIVPICTRCKKIRDDQGFWNQVEKYISERTEAEFSHGICPECAAAVYGDFYRNKDRDRTIHSSPSAENGPHAGGMVLTINTSGDHAGKDKE